MSKHAIENLITDQKIIDRAFAAMITARVTGSNGATEIQEIRVGNTLLSESTTVERITTGGPFRPIGTNGFRVKGLGNDAVIVATSAKSTRHVDSDAELDEAVAAELASLEEPYDPDEDYLRSLIHDLDI